MLLADSANGEWNWPVLAPVIVGALAVWYLLPVPKRRPVPPGALMGLLAAGGLGAFLIQGLGTAVPQTVEAILFAGFSLSALVFAGMMITNPNPARSAICFAMVVLSTCGLFLLCAAPFLAAATIIIYAGAIIVTFLFVIMLSQQAGPSSADLRSREPVLGTAAGFIILATLLVGLQRVYDYRSVDGVIDELNRLARIDKLEMLYQSAADPEAVRQERPIPLSNKAKQLLADARSAANRLTLGAPRTDDARQLTDHPEVRSVENALTSLEISGFKLNDLHDIRTNCKRAAEGLAALKNWRESGMKPVDVPSSGHSEAKAVPGSAGPRRLPSANVSAIGRSLFSDHLASIELAGTLLLIATVGAIAIAGRRKERAE